MGKFKVNFVVTSATIAIFVFLSSGIFDTTSATYNHNYGCRPYDDYGVRSSDGDDNHANFNFHDNNKEVNIWADSGYIITGVWLDLHNGSDNFVYFGSNSGNYNPSGSMTIDRAKAHVVKNCPTPTPSPSPTPTTCPTETPRPSPTITPDPSSTPVNTPTVAPTETPIAVDPTPSIDPNDKCTNIDGVQNTIPDGWFQLNTDSTVCRQFQYGGPPSNNTTVSVDTTEPQGQVLGASTMAGAGSFAETFYQAIMGIGGTLTAMGVRGLKKNNNNVKKATSKKKSKSIKKISKRK